MATRVLGVDRLNRKLRRFPEAAEQEIRKAMEQGAEEVVRLAKSLVPVDTGELKESIGWTWGAAPEGSMVLGEVRGSREGNLRITIYAGDSGAFYARWIEHGTSKMPASPFFFVSYRALRRRVRSRITRSITKSAKRVAAGG